MQPRKTVAQAIGYLAAAFVSCLFVGCDTNINRSGKRQSLADDFGGKEISEPAGSFSNNLTSSQILKRVVDRYAQAQTYSDSAVLHLKYRLLGKPIEEPRPFEVTWQKGQKFASKIFKGQLSCDGNLLSCYIYDIRSGNLDGQQLLLPVEQSSVENSSVSSSPDSNSLPLTQLYEDSIVRHYLGGYADLPLDETYKARPPRLIPPTLSLLSQQLPFGWVQGPTASQRLPDQTFAGKKCFVVRSMFDDMTADIWVDQETDLLVKVSMPLKIMDRQVLTSGEIEDVELTIQFHDARIDDSLTPQELQRFEVTLKNRATPVRRFVKVPDDFPSQLIGEMVPRFDLRTPQGKPIDRLYFDGRPTLLLWIAGMDRMEETIFPKLAELAAQYPPDGIRMGVVYSNTEVAAANSIRPSEALAEAATKHQIPLYFDQELQVAARFELKTMPAAVILNPNSRLEFVRALTDDQWSEDLTVAFQRVVRGERIAEEMRNEYEKFVAQYHQQLDAVAAHRLLGIDAPTIDSQPAETPRVKTSDLKPAFAWKNVQLRRPGNLLVDAGGTQPRLYTLDGWRTVVELDLSGQEMERFPLELPAQAAVSCLRIISSPAIPNDNSQVKFAAFGVKADRVYLFNADWKLITTLPASDFPHDGIRDVQFVSAIDDGDSISTNDLVVAFTGGHGCYRFQLDRKQMTLISRLRADSIAAWLGQVYYATADSFGLLDEEGDLLNHQSGDWMYQRLVSLETISRQNPGFLGLTMVDRENNWSLARVDDQGRVVWRQPVGSQLFDLEIEPLAAGINGDGQVLVAVADASHRITLVSGDGRYRGQVTATEPLTGIGLYGYQGVFHLVVATEKGMTGYRLDSANTPAIQVSHPSEK